MAGYRLLGRVQNDKGTFYKVSDGRKNLEWSLDEISYQLGKRSIINSVGYLRGTDIMVKAPEFDNEPINILDLPMYIEPQAVQPNTKPNLLSNAPDTVTKSTVNTPLKKPDTIKLSKDAVENTQNTTKQATQAPPKVNVAKPATPNTSTKTTSTANNKTASAVNKVTATKTPEPIKQPNIQVQKPSVQPKPVQAPVQKTPVPQQVDNSYNRVNSTHNVFMQALDAGLRKTFIDCQRDIAQINKNSVSQNCLEINIISSRKEKMLLRLDFLGMINVLFVIDGREVIRSSYIANSDGAANLLSEIKAQLTKSDMNVSNTGAVTIGTTDYMRMMNDIVGRIAREVYGKISNGYRNKAVDVKYNINKNVNEISGIIKYTLLQNMELVIQITCHGDNSFVVRSIDCEGYRFRVSRSKYTFTNSGIKQVCSDVLSSIVNSGVLDNGLEDDAITVSNADSEMSKQLASIAEELQLAISKQMNRVMSTVFITQSELKNTGYSDKGSTGTIDLYLSSNNIVHVGMRMDSKEFSVAQVVDEQGLVNYSGRYSYKLDKIFYDRLAVEIVDKLIGCRVIY